MILVVAAFIVIAVFLVKRGLQARKKASKLLLPYPPSPPTRFFWGNALEIPDPRFGVHLDIKLLEWAKEYGTVFSFTVPIVGRLIVCADPDLVKHVAVTKNFPKSFTYQVYTPIFGKRSILVAEAADWFAKRRAFNPGFAPSFLRNMVSVIATKIDRFTTCIEEDIDADRPVHMLHRSQTFTSDVIVQVAYGEDWGGSKSHPPRLWMTELTELTSDVTNNPFVKYFGLKTAWRIRHLEKLLDKEFYRILDRRLVEATTPRSMSPNSAQEDICSIAINQMKRPDGSLSDEDKESVMHQLKTFYFAGHDTTATLLSWAVWLLSQDEKALEKLRAELYEQNIWTNEETPSYDLLQKCPYLEAVLKEALRLYPPAASARFTSDVSETWGGYTIGGTVLYLSSYVMHRHPDLWDCPDDFVPERFIDASGSLAKKWNPWSRGPRDCLGKYFAMLEAKMALSSLVLKYNLACVDPTEEICYKVTACPRDGALVKMSRRKKLQ
jgi:cytochrome P450